MKITARFSACLVKTAVVVLAGASAALAQSPIVNPTTVEFDPSADHAAVGQDGQPLVQRYDLRMYPVGATTPSVTTDLGKPSPGADGKIRVNFAAITSPWPPPDGTYEARVAAVGANGAGESTVSNPFIFGSQAACTYSLSAASAEFPAAGGSGSVDLVAGAGCAWNAAGPPSWLTIAPATGSGSATIALTAAPNGPSPRSAMLTIAGVAFTVSQPAGTCTYALSPAAIQVGSNGGSGAVAMTATTGCGWAATSDAAWVTLATSAGTGSGAIGYTIAKNTTGVVRFATIAAGGLSSTITQGSSARPSKPKKPHIVVAANQ